MSEVEETTPAPAPVEEEAAPAEEPAPAEEEDDDELTVDLDALPKMKVSELKDILKALDLPTSGIKTTLIERIQEHFAEEDKQVEKTEEKVEEKATPEEEELLKEETKPAPEFIELEKKAEEKKEVIETELKADTKTDDEKKEIRAAKFGVETDKSVEDKKVERAAKFGIDTPESAAQKKAKRAERFSGGAATKVASPKLSVTSEDKTKDDEKLKKRAARFNIGEDAPAPKAAKVEKLNTIKYDVSEVLKEKLEKTGKTTVDLSAAALSLEERKKMRALKFGA